MSHFQDAASHFALRDYLEPCLWRYLRECFRSVWGLSQVGRDAFLNTREFLDRALSFIPRRSLRSFRFVLSCFRLFFSLPLDFLAGLNGVGRRFFLEIYPISILLNGRLYRLGVNYARRNDGTEYHEAEEQEKKQKKTSAPQAEAPRHSFVEIRQIAPSPRGLDL